MILDHEYCGDKGTLGASCFHTLTDETREIPKAEWDDMRFGQICTNDPDTSMGATFADTKAVIEKLCSLSHRCDYQTKTLIANFFERVNKLNVDAQALTEKKTFIIP